MGVGPPLFDKTVGSLFHFSLIHNTAREQVLLSLSLSPHAYQYSRLHKLCLIVSTSHLSFFNPLVSCLFLFTGSGWQVHITFQFRTTVQGCCTL